MWIRGYEVLPPGGTDSRTRAVIQKASPSSRRFTEVVGCSTIFFILTRICPLLLVGSQYEEELYAYVGGQVARPCSISTETSSLSTLDGSIAAFFLIQSSFIGKEAIGSHDTPFKYNTMCDADIRKDLYAMSCCQVARPWSK